MSTTAIKSGEQEDADVLKSVVLDPKGDAPLHRQLSTQLRDKIKSEFSDGDVFFTEDTLVGRLPVSRITVRRALEDLRVEGLLKRQVGRGTTVVKPTRRAVTRTASPSAAATDNVAVTSEATVRRIGMFVTGYDSDYMKYVTQATADVCAYREIEEHVYSTSLGTRIPQALERVKSTPDEEALVLFTPSNETLAVYRNLTERGYRTVCIDGIPADYPGPCISTDARAAVRIALDHLCGLGHERILLLVNEPMRDTSVTDKMDEFVLAMRERGLAQSARFLFCGTQHGESSFDAAYAHMSEVWMAPTDQRPTAIFAVSDPGAWAAMRWLSEQGISVPGDVSVMGFEDAPPSRHMHPALTTIAHDVREISERAVAALISSRDIAGMKELVMPNLVIRETTGSAKTHTD